MVRIGSPGSAIPIDNTTFNLTRLLNGTVLSSSSSQIVVAATDGVTITLEGFNLALQSGSTIPFAGTISDYSDDKLSLDFISQAAGDFASLANTGNSITFLAGFFAGNDTSNGTGGNDIIQGFAGNDSFDGGLGNDQLFGGLGRDNLEGGQGRDTIRGGEGRDTLFGEAGFDTIIGGLGLDSIGGGLGNDTLTGGVAADTFYYELPTEGTDTITDFTITEDQLRFRARNFGFSDSNFLLPNSAFVQGTAALDADDRFIYDQNTGILLFDGDGSNRGQAVHILTLENRAQLVAGNIFISFF